MMVDTTKEFEAMAQDEKEFDALAQGKHDYTVPVIRIEHRELGDLMTVCATEEAIYITKEQAMKFFNLTSL